jgi:hypothetical protein
MLQMSVLCAATCVPAIIVSAVVMAAPISGLPASVAVARISWLPS